MALEQPALAASSCPDSAQGWRWLALVLEQGALSREQLAQLAMEQPRS